MSFAEQLERERGIARGVAACVAACDAIIATYDEATRPHMKARVAIAMELSAQAATTATEPDPGASGSAPRPSVRLGGFPKTPGFRKGMRVSAASATPAPAVGPTERIVRVLAASQRPMTSPQIIAELDRVYPGVSHKYAHQILSRNADRADGVIMRGKKDPRTKLYLYSLREQPDSDAEETGADGDGEEAGV